MFCSTHMKTLIQAAAVTLFAASAAQAQQAVQWKVSDGGNGHWYRFDAVSREWPDAQRLASAAGGHLATVSDAAESAFVDQLVETSHPSGWVWLGGTLVCSTPASPNCTDCTWTWVTDEPWSYQAWAPGEPNCLYPTERTATLSGVWVDIYSPGHVNQSMWEWSADCNSDGIVDYGQILDGSLSDVNADGVPDACQAPCVPSDLNNDGAVDGSDLGALLSDWGPAAGQGTRADINGDGIVNGADLGTLLSNWGPCGAAPTWATVIQWQPDPAVVTDAQFRDGIQATGLPWRVRDTGTGIEMLLVPPGTFEMGCSGWPDESGCDSSERPVHQVNLTNAWYLGRYEVTQAQWVATMGTNPSHFQGHPDSANRPVEQVSWNAIHGYMSAAGMRLPTEAEWEYACRAGTQTPFYTDDDSPSELAWFYHNACQGGEECGTREVGLKAANAFGFHDMLGNVWEWVNDWHGSYEAAPQFNPGGPATGWTRVARGGSFVDFANSTFGVRSSSRFPELPQHSRNTLGFRVARNP